MSEGNDQDAAKGRLSLRPAGRLELGRTVDAGSVRQSFSHGRSKEVQVEVRKKRAPFNAPAPRPVQPIHGAPRTAAASGSVASRRRFRSSPPLRKRAAARKRPPGPPKLPPARLPRKPRGLSP